MQTAKRGILPNNYAGIMLLDDFSVLVVMSPVGMFGLIQADDAR